MAPNRKPRILYMAKILFEETDAEHGLSLPQIQERLEEHGVASERKALYRDLEHLRTFGLDIQKLPTRPVSYALARRPFTPEQMALLLDAVRTSRTLTEANAQDLTEKLHRLQSIHQADATRAQVHVSGRVGTQNAAVLDTLSIIRQALAEKRDISFEYVRYDCKLNLVKAIAEDGQERLRTPLFLLYADDKYYLLTFDESAPDHIRSYRVDRMANVMIRDESDAAHRPDASFDINRYERERLGMYNLEPVRIKLLVPQELIGQMVDIFGLEGTSSVPTSPDEEMAFVHVTASPSPVLFSQIAQFGGKVRILGPQRVAKAYQAHLQACLADQGAPETEVCE